MLSSIPLLLYSLGIMSLLAGSYTIYLGYRFRAKADEVLSRKLVGYKPKTAVLMPCKGIDQDFDSNVKALLSQDYPDFTVFFIVDDKFDPAYERLISLIMDSANAKILVTEPQPGFAGKIAALRTGLTSAPKEYDVFAFADSDTQPPRTWLRDLVDALGEESVGASTGYRWYFPKRGFWSLLRSAWNASTTNLLFHPHYSFAWGGAYAIKRSLLLKLGIPEAWRDEVSDDLVLTRLLKDAGKDIQFLPHCMVASFEDCDFTGLLEWTIRQTIITKHYSRRIWNYAALSYATAGFLFLTGISAMFISLADLTFLPPSLFLVAGYFLGGMRSVQRLRIFRKSMPGFSEEFSRLGFAFHIAGLIVPWLMLYNIFVSARRRRIAWRGNVFQLE